MSLLLEEGNQDAWPVLRLLSGPLSGCEYRLPTTTTLLVAGAADTLLGDRADAEIPEFPSNAIVVPIDGGINFEIIINDNARGSFRLRILGEDPEEQLREYQEICQVGTLKFAVRSAYTDWEPVLAQDEQITSDKPVKTRKNLLIKVVIVAVALFVLIGAALALWMMSSEKKRVTEVSAIISGSSEQYQTLKGRNGIVYIFANSERDVSWARQALSREGLVASTRVSTSRDEEMRIHRLILENYPALNFHRLKLNTPAKPVLLLSQERTHLSPQERQALFASLMSWMPYAEKVSAENLSDVMLDRRARSGLERLGVTYQRSGAENSINYSIQGDLNDIELTHLQTLTDDFYRDFGVRYINFSVALKDDWLKSKSFGYGASGYVKMTPQHWFFPEHF